jgi:hypothetical protein
VFFNEHLSQQSSAIKGLRRKTQIGQDPLSHSEPLATLIRRPSRARKVQTTAARRHCRPGLPKRRDGVIPPCLVEHAAIRITLRKPTPLDMSKRAASAGRADWLRRQRIGALFDGKRVWSHLPPLAGARPPRPTNFDAS